MAEESRMEQLLNVDLALDAVEAERRQRKSVPARLAGLPEKPANTDLTDEEWAVIAALGEIDRNQGRGPAR